MPLRSRTRALLAATATVMAACSGAGATTPGAPAAPSSTASSSTAGPSTSPSMSSPPDTPPPRSSTTSPAESSTGAAAQTAARALVALAADPGPETAAGVPFAAYVRLGLGPTLLTRTTRTAVADAGAWSIRPPGDIYRASVGPFSALDELSRHLDRVGGTQEAFAIRTGDHPDCFRHESPAPEGLTDATRVAVQAADGTIDSCIDWFSVDLFVEAGEVVAVTLDIGEP